MHGIYSIFIQASTTHVLIAIATLTSTFLALDLIGGALDLFRAASDGEVNQSSSPSPSKVEEENFPSFKQTEVQPPMANSIATPTKGPTSITMMHCNYHSIYPEESTNSSKIETDFTSPYASRVRSVSAAIDPDSGYDSCYRKRRQSETSNTSPMSKKNGGPPSSSSSLDYRSRRHSTTMHLIGLSLSP